ncbi:Gx transporter family protein [Christensenellaceae bacterium OttesenSCG-928-K19]|nr:Gx transporter family protein [Christensenellaceae bacterium OttesenSCG-928-K19]
MPLQDNKTKKFVLAAVLCGVALALSLVDNAVSSAIAFLPGFKLGLANVMSLYALYTLGLPYAMMILLARSFLTALLSGNLTMLLFSLTGGAASILVMFALARVVSLIKASVSGGITHNCMQVLVAVLFTSTPQTAYYLPVLIGMGAVSGFAMGVICRLVVRKMPNTKFVYGTYEK